MPAAIKRIHSQFDLMSVMSTKIFRFGTGPPRIVVIEFVRNNEEARALCDTTSQHYTKGKYPIQMGGRSMQTNLIPVNIGGSGTNVDELAAHNTPSKNSSFMVTRNV